MDNFGTQLTISNQLLNKGQSRRVSFAPVPLNFNGNTNNRRNMTKSISMGNVSYPFFNVEWKVKPFRTYYNCVNFLGKGAQGMALSLKNINLNGLVVAKVYPDTEENRKSVTREITVLKHLNDNGSIPFILGYQEHFIARHEELPLSCQTVMNSTPNKTFLVIVYDYFLGPETIPLSKIIEYEDDEQFFKDFHEEDYYDEQEEVEEIFKEREMLETFVNPASYLKIVTTLLRSVSYLHENGVAHLDLKPDNIIINVNSKRVQLIDFGFKVEASKGYMIFIYDKLIKKPYFRKGLLRVSK